MRALILPFREMRYCVLNGQHLEHCPAPTEALEFTMPDPADLVAGSRERQQDAILCNLRISSHIGVRLASGLADHSRLLIREPCAILSAQELLPENLIRISLSKRRRVSS
jgi:hypothetical protein